MTTFKITTADKQIVIVPEKIIGMSKKLKEAMDSEVDPEVTEIALEIEFNKDSL